MEKVLLVLNHKEIVCHILVCFILMWLLRVVNLTKS